MHYELRERTKEIKREREGEREGGERKREGRESERESYSKRVHKSGDIFFVVRNTDFEVT